MPYTEPHYRFAALSDIHIDLENGGKGPYFLYAEQNFTRALQVIRALHCDFIVSAGDQVTNAAGAEAEWRRYREIIRDSGYTGNIFAAMGNHETRFAKYGGCTVEACRREFIAGAALDELPIRRPAEKTYYLYEEPVFGDAFLFLSLENGVDTNLIDNFTDEQMDWVEEAVDRCLSQQRRVFLIQHAPLYGFGAGDDVGHPAYEGSMRLTAGDGKPFYQNQRFLRLIQRHKDIIWLSGHTHVDFQDKVTYSTDHGNACHMLHIPALAGSTRIAGSGPKRRLDRTFRPDSAQGYIADVFRDHTVFREIDFYENIFSDTRSYRIAR